MKNLQKKTILDLCRILSVLSILATFLFDLIQKKTYHIGPFQAPILGFGIGLFLFSILFEKKEISIRSNFCIGFLLMLISFLSTLRDMVSHQNTLSILIINGIIFGAGFYFAMIYALQMNQKKSGFLGETLYFICLILPFLIWVFRYYLQIDLWYDEIYTLERYVFSTIGETLTNYSSTNNHIFLNLISNLYLRVIGIDDIYQLMENIFSLRLLMLSYAILTLIMVYWTGKRFFHQKFSAGSAVLVLATTVPFYNFSVQIRGYGLSSLLVSILLFFCWANEEKPRLRNSFIISTLVFLILYTIPTNLYIILSIGLFYGFRLLGHFVLSIKRSALFSRSKQILHSPEKHERYYKDIIPIAGIAVGGIISALAYLPVANEFLSQMPSAPATSLFSTKTFRHTFPFCMQFFLSERWLFYAILLIGCLLLLIFHHKSISARGSKILFPGYMLLMPFIINEIFGHVPYMRVFVMLSPFFALLIAACMNEIFIYFEKHAAVSWSIFAIFFVYCYISFAGALNTRDSHLLQDIEQGTLTQNPFYNYYQAYYHPQDIIKAYRDKFFIEYTPVYVYYWGDAQSTPYYLNKYDVNYTALETPDQIILDDNGKAFVFSAFPKRSVTEIMESNPGLVCRVMNEEPYFLNLLLCEMSLNT